MQNNSPNVGTSKEVPKILSCREIDETFILLCHTLLHKPEEGLIPRLPPPVQYYVKPLQGVALMFHSN